MALKFCPHGNGCWVRLCIFVFSHFANAFPISTNHSSFLSYEESLCHGAYPHQTIDPIYIGTLIIQALQGIISRCSPLTDPVVLSITQFHAGNTHNVIPSTATFQGTLRAITSADRAMLKEKLMTITTGIATSFGATATITFSYSFPPTLNHLQETNLTYAVAKKVLGEERLAFLSQRAMASEDFSYYLEKIPGSYFWVGMGQKEYNSHHPRYEFNDEIIPIATELLAKIVIAYLK